MPSASDRPAIVAHDVVVRWPDGTSALGDAASGLDLVVPAGRSGLVGANGSGKTTLLNVVAGVREPDAGTVSVRGHLAYLPQHLTLDVAHPVDAFLGIADVCSAIAALEAGEQDPARLAALLEAVGDDWDVEERTVAELSRLGLPVDVLDRRLGELSGGEVTRLALARLLVGRPDVLLLDEPTNNLDSEARGQLYEVVRTFSGSLLVVSHDRDLLELVDRIGELRGGGVRWYGGGWTAYSERVAAEQDAARRAVVAAEADVRRQKADALEAERVIAAKRRQGLRNAATSNMGKAGRHYWANRSEKHSAAYREVHAERLGEATDRLTEAEALVHDDPSIRVDLPGTVVPPGREVLTTSGLVLRTGLAVDLDLRGPERVAVVGRNGSGKTTLLRTLVGELDPLVGEVRRRVPVRLLPQRLTLLDDSLTVAENVAAAAPGVPVGEVRARLARFLFRGRGADRAARVLSGGERFRATLATLLLADPPPQLLLLDEPTNNLDLASYQALVTALASYAGCLVVVSHDHRFLDEIGVTRTVDLDTL